MKKYHVVLGDMTVGGARAIFVNTDVFGMNESIASFESNEEAEEFITDFLEDDEYGLYYRYSPRKEGAK